MVGVTGLEPATSSSRTTRASQLRYTPWSQEWDLNPRPTRYECVALPTELSWQARDKIILNYFAKQHKNTYSYIR